METRKNVRERRIEKIRMLQDGASGRRFEGRDRSHMEFPQDRQRRGLHPEGMNRADGDDLGPLIRTDPEVEWNRKWKREFSDYGKDDGDGPFREHGSWKERMGVRILVSGLLFAAVWGMFQLNHPLADQGKKWVASALTESFDARAFAGWYERRFGGAPSFLPAISSTKHQDAQKVSAATKHYFTPVQGKLIAAFTPGLNGVLVEAKAGAPVAAVDTGWVSFAGVKEDSGFTVVLKHTDGIESVYGHLEQGKVQLNDWIKGGETLGTVAKPKGQSTGTLFFAIAENGKPVNPTDVISFE